MIYHKKHCTYVDEFHVLNSRLVIPAFASNQRIVDDCAIAAPRHRYQRPSDCQEPHSTFFSAKYSSATTEKCFINK